MLHVEACSPSVSQRVACFKSSKGAPVHEEESAEKAPSSSDQGAAQNPGKELYQLPEMQGLSKSWQALANVLCQAAADAADTGIIHSPTDVESHNRLALRYPNTASAAEMWKSVKLLMDSRAWWWGTAVFDGDVQACFFDAGDMEFNAACAMTAVADLMLREHSKLECSAALLRTIYTPSEDPRSASARSSWAQKVLKIADEVLSTPG